MKVLRDNHADLLLEGETEEDLKRHRLEQKLQFQAEAVVLSKLRHPNIVNFLGYFIHDNEVRVSLR